MIRCATLAAVVLCFGLVHSTANAQPVGGVEIVKVDAKSYQRLAYFLGDPVPSSRPMIRSPSGKVFVVVRLELKPKPGKDDDGEDAVVLEAEDMALVDEKGTKYAMVGNCSRDGRFTPGEEGFYLYPGEEFPPLAEYDLVFVVPQSVKNATIKMGDAEKKFALPANVLPTIDPTQIATFKIQQARVVTKLESKYELGPLDNPAGEGTIETESTATRFLSLKILIQPKANNTEYGFSATSSDFGLLLGKEVFVTAIGHASFDGFTYGNAYLSSDVDKTGKHDALEKTLFFPLPGRIKTFKLLYLTRPVANGTISP